MGLSLPLQIQLCVGKMLLTHLTKPSAVKVAGGSAKGSHIAAAAFKGQGFDPKAVVTLPMVTAVKQLLHYCQMKPLYCQQGLVKKCLNQDKLKS